MRSVLPVPAIAAAALCVAPSPVAAQNPLELLHQQQGHYWFTVESVVDPTDGLEAADDFDLVAAIERVRIGGSSCWSCTPGDLISARIAFYEWTPGGPGALQAEYVLQDGDPGLAYSEGPGLIDVTLPVPFQATGQHFLAAQVEVDGYWSWQASNYSEPLGATVFSRTDPSGPWSPHVITYPAGPANSDLAFELYGADSTPPTGGTDPAGEWTVVPTPEPSDGFDVFLRDVVALGPDDAWAVGGYSKVTPPFLIDKLSWIQRWDGQQWSHVPSPNPEPYPGGGSLTLYAVDAAAPDDVWAAGTYRTVAPDGFLGGQMFVVHWDGTSWTQIPAPMTTGGSGTTVRDIEVVGPDDVWFFGFWVAFENSALGEQRALAMHWDGNEFTFTFAPFFDNSAGYGGGHSIESADALAPDDIWAVGGAFGSNFTPHSYITHWDGTGWEHVPGPTPGAYNRLYAVQAIATDDVWAVGYYLPLSGGSYEPLYLHWDGTSWEQVDAPGGAKALLHRPAQGDLVAGGGINTTDGMFRWDGTSWQSVMDFPTVANPNLTRLALVPGTGEVWGVGRQNGPDAGGLTVRLDRYLDQASVAALEPCSGSAPPDSLLAAPLPTVGKHLSLAVHDPTSSATVTPGSLALISVGAPTPGGCGVVVDGFGPDEASGELLLGGAKLLPITIWGGPEQPAVVDVTVPSDPSLLGAQVAVQGALVDLFDGDVVLTRGLLLTFGN